MNFIPSLLIFKIWLYFFFPLICGVLAAMFHKACWEIPARKEYGSPALLKRRESISLAYGNSISPQSFCFLNKVVRAYVSAKHTLFSIWCHHLTGWQKPTELAQCRAQQMEHRLLPTVARTVVWFCCDWTAKRSP